MTERKVGILVLIGGGGIASGKTTIASVIEKALRDHGFDPACFESNTRVPTFNGPDHVSPTQVVKIQTTSFVSPQIGKPV